MSHAYTISQAARMCALPSRFPLERGGFLKDAILAYEFFGDEGGPVVLVQGGISSDSHVASNDQRRDTGWWEDVVGPGKAIDTNRFSVLSLDLLGGSGATSGPRSHGTPFPSITALDQARATALLLKELSIEKLHAAVGASYGGMVVLALASLPEALVKRMVIISAAHRPDVLGTAWRSLQRRVLDFGREVGRELEGLAIARSMAMATYRTAAEFEQRFSREPVLHEEKVSFPVEDYLRSRGDAWASKMDPEAFRVLSQAIDLSSVDPKSIQARCTLVGVIEDELVRIETIRSLHAQLGDVARLESIHSLFGHDAFLREITKISLIIRAAILDEVPR